MMVLDVFPCNRKLRLRTVLIVVCSVVLPFLYQTIFSNNQRISDSTTTAIIGKDSDNHRPYYCSNYAYTNGSWSVAPVLDDPTVGSDKSNVLNAYGFPSYVWKVNSPTDRQCQLEDWDLDLFCTTLNGRSILMVGDSINQQWFGAILHLTQGRKEQPCGAEIVSEKTGEPVCVRLNGRICKGTSRLTFIRNVQLSLTLNRTWNQEPWIHLIHNYQVLILNRGAHPQLMDIHRQLLSDVKSALQNYNGSVFLRTTPRGHIGCSNDTVPLTSELDSNWKRYFPDTTNNESSSSSPTTTTTTTTTRYQNYKYAWFPEQNLVYKEIFEPHQVLDVQRITELRPDGHKNPPYDCLHYANWEVFQTWLWLLLNGLRHNLRH